MEQNLPGSKMIKIVSIIILVSAGISLLIVLPSLLSYYSTINELISLLHDKTYTNLLPQISALNLSFYFGYSILSSIIKILCGILGLAYRNKKNKSIILFVISLLFLMVNIFYPITTLFSCFENFEIISFWSKLLLLIEKSVLPALYLTGVIKNME